MAKPTTPKPTETEVEILSFWWQNGPSTVRQVHELLVKTRGTGYTTALKLLQIMHEKGLVKRDETNRTHIYRPTNTQIQTQRQLLRDLIPRAFGGSTRDLIIQALAVKKPSAKELAAIKKHLSKL